MRSSLGVVYAPHVGEKQKNIVVSERNVRELLRMLRRPFLLEQNELALTLRDAYDTTGPLEAVHALIRESVSDSPAFGNLYAEIIQRCDVRAESTKQAAAAMNMSIRTFFRFRKDALMVVVLTVSRRLRSLNSSATSLAPQPKCPIHGAHAC
jgi:hypothetical protein